MWRRCFVWDSLLLRIIAYDFLSKGRFTTKKRWRYFVWGVDSWAGCQLPIEYIAGALFVAVNLP